VYQYRKYWLCRGCTQIDLVRKLFDGDRLRSTRTLWANSLCKLVRKNERSLYRETAHGILVPIADAETIAEFDRLQVIYPHLVLSQSVQFEERQEADEVENW